MLWAFRLSVVFCMLVPLSVCAGTLSLFPFGGRDWLAARNTPAFPGTFSVEAHGSPTTVFDKFGRPISPVQLAIMIKSDPRYVEGQPVTLNSCSTGGPAGSGEGSYAQQLANALKTLIIAPNADLSGDVYGVDIVRGGKWIVFRPQSL